MENSCSALACFIQRWHHVTGRLCFPLHWRSCQAETSLKSKYVWLYLKNTHTHKHTQFCFKCSKIIFSTFVFLLLFSKLLWTTNLIAHTVSTHSHTVQTHAPTHTHTVELPTWIDLNTHAYLPLWNSSLCSLKAPKLLPASSPPVCTPSPSILPSSHLSFGSYLVYRPPLLLIPLLFEVLARTSLLGIENIESTDCSTRCISIKVKEDRWLMISP